MDILLPFLSHEYNKNPWTSLSKTTMRCYLTLIRMAIIKKTRNNKYSKEVEKRKPFSTVGGNVNW